MNQILKKSATYHIPVMSGEVLDYLIRDEDGIYVDGTLGAGGHSYAIFGRLSHKGWVIGIDWDERAIEIARKRLEPHLEQVTIVKCNFADIGEILNDLGISKVDGILLDLGISSMHIEEEGRGFSFMRDEPLDMRMDRDKNLTACDLVNGLSQEELADIIWRYGEERWARRIAREICKRREEKRIETTGELSRIVSSVIPVRYGKKRVHPATKTFQALRIVVNDELNNLKRVIYDGIDVLKPSGRFCIISFHSLEDRVVKESFRELEKGCICPPELPECICEREPRIRIITKRPIKPSAEELTINPRSRSAKLRVAECI